MIARKALIVLERSAVERNCVVPQVYCSLQVSRVKLISVSYNAMAE